MYQTRESQNSSADRQRNCSFHIPTKSTPALVRNTIYPTPNLGYVRNDLDDK